MIRRSALATTLASVSRLFGFGQTRSLDAAGGGRRWADDRRVTTAGDLHAGASTIGARAAHFAANNPIGARMVDSLVGNLVGTGIVPRSEHPSGAVRARLQGAFKAWVDMADAEGRADFFALQAHAARDLATYGEFVFALTAGPDGAPRLRRLHPEQLDRTYTRQTATAVIHQGVELDADGRVAAYWIRRAMPGEPLAALPVTPVRVAASDILHGFRQLMPGQVRGVSWFAPVLVPARELDALMDAMLVRAKVAALHAGFVRDAKGEVPYAGEQAGDEFDASLEPGALIMLPEGKDIELPAVPDQGGAQALMTAGFRLIAAGAGVSYSAATGDYSQANYSSERAQQLEIRRFYEAIQHHVMVFSFCRPVWRKFMTWQVLRGTVSAAQYLSDPAIGAAKWLPPAWPWVDPQSDLAAAEIELRLGLASRAQKIAERGYDVEDIDRERAADRQRETSLGIAPQAPPPAAPEVRAEMMRRAALKPATANDADRTIELVASAGADVPRMDIEGAFLERLSITKDAIDLGRLDGMPVLDSHRQDGLERVLGVVLDARIERGRLITRIQISARHDAIWADIRAGVIGNVSVGYVPLAWRDEQDPRTGARVRIVTRWELREVSLVPVGADPAGKVRSQETQL